ncbi:MAG TPA: ring-cleaving dioxygenase [Bryobacteraceae bacterium]|nr:ring-cleaving dioxygenase [Bryobacteraceae bacterium]
MGQRIEGLHHVTAIAGDPQRNLDFYAGVLGLRLVKLTVNFDDPATYHLYYGDAEGRPGSILTFFPWPGAPRGRAGTGQVTTVMFSIPQAAAGYWNERLAAKGIPCRTEERFGAEALAFADPDGLPLELVANDDARAPWAGGPVPVAQAIRGIYGVTLAEEGYERTAGLLIGTLNFDKTEERGSRFRFETGDGGAGAVADVECLPDRAPGRLGVGTVHHVAWRAPDDASQLRWHDKVARAGANVTPVIDRKYFHSIYFREPGGVLFEVATDPPGFAVDEPAAELGTHLMLPPWLEPGRAELEQALPPLRLQAAGA